MYRLLLITLLLTVSWLPASSSAASPKAPAAAALDWAERIADSTMQRHPEAWAMRPNKGLTEPSWGYTYGLALLGFERLHQRSDKQAYLDYAKTYVDQLIDETGNIRGYRSWDYNIDSINAGKLLFMLYEQTGDERYRIAMQSLRAQFDWHPRTRDGGLWHKLIYPWQMWLDGLYMGAAYYAQYAAAFDEPAAFDDITRQFVLIEEKTRDPESGLLYHGWDESRVQPWSDKTTGLSKHFWSRGTGWYAMALVDAIEHYPENHPGRAQLLDILKRLVTAIVKVQHSSGLWYQVLDQGDRKGNYLEASGSAMFAYAIARGVNQGYLDDDLALVARRAFNGLVTQLIKVDTGDGTVSLTGICGSAGLGGDPYRPGTFDYYISEPQVDNDPHGTGPFILAALEIDRLQ